MRGRLPLLLLTLVLAGSAPARAQTISAAARERGWVSITVTGSDGQRFGVFELAGYARERIAGVTIRHGKARLQHAARWRCDRYERRFQAAPLGQPGALPPADSTPIRTPSCARRLALSVTPGRGRRIAVDLVDRFGVGDVKARVCVTAPGGKTGCRPAALAPGVTRRSFGYAARSSGFWSAGLVTDWGQRAANGVYVRPAGTVRLLATGDSMIEHLDAFLKKRLAPRGVRVRSDVRIGTGISKPFLLDWPAHARRQARAGPDATVVFLGANDGFAFGDSDCCGEAWVKAYAARAAKMMRAYARRGAAVVYWLTLPAPRPERWREVFPAVNRAIELAAQANPWVRVLDLANTFTPDGRFRSTMTWHGRRVTVRQGDGIHLSVAGAAIAESIVERAMRQDGVLG